jgi:hypothetical protein
MNNARRGIMAKGKAYLIQMYLESRGIDYVPEYQGIPGRKFRFDFAVPADKIAIEYEGGTYSGGAHIRGAHYASDCEKYSLAAIHGWRVIRLTVDMFKCKKGSNITTAEILLNAIFGRG